MRAIFDASVFVRALADGDPIAAHWVDRAIDEVVVTVPSLLFAEAANGFAVYVRAARLSEEGALARLEFTLRVPHHVVEIEALAPAALGVAVERELSVYDACYVVLAEAEGALLVTADRRLAGAVTQAELL